MTQRSKSDDGRPSHDFATFVHKQVSALSEVFADLPLKQMRVTTPSGSVTLVKSAGTEKTPEEGREPERQHLVARSQHDYLPNGEPGHAYDLVNADVVGVFHAAQDLPQPGERIDPDRVMGYIEALKLRTPVKAGVAGTLVGQVAEDGQAVDFGETLFIVDSGAPEQPAPSPAPEEPLEAVEPPRI